MSEKLTDPALFRQRLAALMQRRRLTQTALAEAAKSTPANVSRVLSGKQTPDLEYAGRLARAAGVELWRLLKP